MELGKSGHLFYGSYVSAKSEVYQIKINYQYDEKMKEGIVGNL